MVTVAIYQRCAIATKAKETELYNKIAYIIAAWLMRGVLGLLLLSATGAWFVTDIAYWEVSLSARRVHLLFQSVVSSICNDIVC